MAQVQLQKLKTKKQKKTKKKQNKKEKKVVNMGLSQPPPRGGPGCFLLLAFAGSN